MHVAAKTTIWSVVAVALVGGGLVLGDHLVRQDVAERARGEIATALGIEPSELTTEVHGWSALWQLGTGRWELITASADDAEVGGVPASLEMAIEGLPTNEVDAITRVEVTVELDEAALEQLVLDHVEFEVDDVSLDPPLLTVTSTPNVLGFDVPVELGLGLSPAEQGLDVDVEELMVSGMPVDLDAAAGLLGALADPLLQTQHVCLANVIPSSLEIESVRISTHGARITITGTEVAVADFGAGVGSCASD